MSRCAPPSPSPRRTLRSLSSSAIRSARVFHDRTVNSFSRSSSSVTSSSASTPSTPRSAAISPTALLQHEVEQLELRLLEHGDLARHRELDRPLAALAQRVAIRLQLLAARVAAGERPPLVAEVLVEQRARKAEGARIQGFTQQNFYFCGFARARPPLHRRLAHHVMPERRERREERQV